MPNRSNKSLPSRNNLFILAALVLLVGMLIGRPVGAVTYISVEPIPSGDVVGAPALNKILSIGYTNLELWSERLVNDCHIVQNVIKTLSAHDAITTVSSRNTEYRVAAGGFEGVTDPTYVFTVEDSGRHAVTAADVAVLDNALGYVLNQGGTTHFSPDHPNAYDFPLEYAVVTFKGNLTGEEAKGFFDFLAGVDPALWTGNFAGFTQVDFSDSPKNNSMLFLQPDVPDLTNFTQELFQAARAHRAQYFPLNASHQATTATAGVSFPGNDWIQFPNGDQYLANLGSTTPALLNALAALRQQHLDAVANLVAAIDTGNVSRYLKHQFKCPKVK